MEASPAMIVQNFLCPADGDAVDVLRVLELHRSAGEVGHLEAANVEPVHAKVSSQSAGSHYSNAKC